MKIKTKAKGFVTVLFVGFVVVAACCIAPMLFLWCVNTLAEESGTQFYIPHTLWTYFVSLIFIMLFNAKSS